MKKGILILILALIPLLSFALDKHIKVEEGRECIECHAKEYEEWHGSAHGVNVLCFICHGSVDKNFVKRASIEKCNGCHQNFVLDIKAKKGIKDCFDCHKPHTLDVKFHKFGG